MIRYTGIKDKNGKKIHEGDTVKRSITGATPTTTNKVYFYKGEFVVGEGDYIKPLTDFCTLEVL